MTGRCAWRKCCPKGLPSCRIGLRRARHLPGGLLPVRVGVWMAGPELRLFVNGEFVFSARDRVLQDGQLGVYARAASSSTLTVSFSDLEVYAIDLAQVPTLTPTASSTPWP